MEESPRHSLAPGPTLRAKVRWALLGLALGAVIAVSGCHSAPARTEPAPHSAPAPNSAWLALPAPAIAAYERSPDSPAPSARFEYFRRDAELNAVRFGPLMAQRQWPEPPRPAERRIRFHYWEQ